MFLSFCGGNLVCKGRLKLNVCSKRKSNVGLQSVIVRRKNTGLAVNPAADSKYVCMKFNPALSNNVSNCTEL